LPSARLRNQFGKSYVGQVVNLRPIGNRPAASGSLQDNSEFLGKPFLRNALQVIPGMT
jgi:hypothetical protein